MQAVPRTAAVSASLLHIWLTHRGDGDTMKQRVAGAARCCVAVMKEKGILSAMLCICFTGEIHHAK